MAASTFPFTWTGDKTPDLAWLAEPLQNTSGDKIAKQVCTGCGFDGEVSLAHLQRIFELFESKLDLSVINWSKHYLEVSACDFCIETAPEKTMVTFVLGKLPK